MTRFEIGEKIGKVVTGLGLGVCALAPIVELAPMPEDTIPVSGIEIALGGLVASAGGIVMWGYGLNQIRRRQEILDAAVVDLQEEIG